MNLLGSAGGLPLAMPQEDQPYCPDNSSNGAKPLQNALDNLQVMTQPTSLLASMQDSIMNSNQMFAKLLNTSVDHLSGVAPHKIKNR